MQNNFGGEEHSVGGNAAAWISADPSTILTEAETAETSSLERSGPRLNVLEGVGLKRSVRIEGIVTLRKSSTTMD